MAQSPAKEQTNPLVGASSVDASSKPNQVSDAQQRPGVSGAQGAETPGQSSGDATAALQTAKESAAGLGEKTPGGEQKGRGDVETK